MGLKRIPYEATTRRQFLKRVTTLAVGATAFPYFVPARALGADGGIAASNRIVMGCIGTGSQGRSNLESFLNFPDAQFVAVCDVDRGHREQAMTMINEKYGNTDCVGYNAFEDLIARGDLDALSIAVPDHWHAIPAIAGAKAKLDMYAEKPLALTITEGQAMVRAVESSGVVWQTGSWQRSQAHFRHACELVRNGRIGEVHTVKVGLPTGKAIEPQPEMPIPDGFDYDRWLGPAPWAPYTEKRCHWDFRWIFDYSGGQLTDWAAHHCDIANWGMGTEHTGPISIEGSGLFPREGIWNTAVNYSLEAIYAPGASPVAPKGFKMLISDSFPNSAEFIGEKGSIYVSRSEIKTNPENLKDSEIGPGESKLYRSRNHMKNFLECVRSREATITPIAAAHRAISIAHIGNIAMKLGRKVHWDPAKEDFINDPQASRRLSRAMRGPWRIEV